MAREIFVDYDGTISLDHFPKPQITPPNSSCIETINGLYDAGFKIVIYSCRANPEIQLYDPTGQNRDRETLSQEATQEMIEYLNKHGIKYHEIRRDKPLYTYLIDDRAGFDGKDWDGVLKNILKRL